VPAAPIETSRLTLRPFRDEDVDALFEIQRNREAMRYTHAASSREDCARWHRAYAALESTLGFAPWTVVLRADGRVIGWGGLNLDQRPLTGSAQLARATPERSARHAPPPRLGRRGR
jgi:RimJ/RimL family protein N-acetyltransferase